MKKRIVSMMLAAMVALSVVGCGSKTLSNDYVTVKQYKGLEVAQVEKVEVTDEQVEQSVQANLNAAAEKELLNYIEQSTPHAYWLARSFVLLSDVYVAMGKDLDARQYLLSLQQNYQGNDDIESMIEDRLKKLNK
mgnify:CR=1 FL=1